MPDITLIVPEVESVNDTEFVITHWHVPSGARVQVGDALVDVETSKSSVEIASEHAGFCYFLLPAGSIVDRSAAVGLISTGELTEGQIREALGVQSHQDDDSQGRTDSDGPVFSERALAALEEVSVPRDRFAAGTFVTEEMVRTEARRMQDSGPSGTRTHPRIDGSALVIVGGGGHAATLLDLLHETRAFTVIGILDDRLPTDQLINGVPIIGQIDDLNRLVDQGCALAVNAVGGVGSRRLRQDIWLRIKDHGFGIPRMIHPSAVVDSSATLGEGAQVLAGSYVGARSHIGLNTIINSRAVISHDCRIGDHSHVAPGAMLAGDVVIGQRTLIGMGATIHMQVCISDDVIVQNNSRITEDLSNGAQCTLSGVQGVMLPLLSSGDYRINGVSGGFH